MCFSPAASFIAGIALSAVGIATIRLTRRWSETPLAMIPLLFGIQQIIEGFIWLSFREGSPLPNGALTLVFSLFSHVLWPMVVPFAVSRIETVPWRKMAMTVSMVAGVGVGMFLLYFLVEYPVTSRVLGKHIVYESPHFQVAAVTLMYLVGTCGGCLVSSDWIIRLFGALLLASFVTAYLIHAATLLSMWCFFAAVLSCVVYAYFGRIRTNEDRREQPTGNIS